MRLLFLTNVFPNPLNPQKGTFNRSLMTELAERHAVRVVSPISWTDEFSARLLRGKKIDRSQPHLIERVSVEYPRYYYPPKFFRNSYGQWMWHSIAAPLREAAEEFRPEAILSYWAHPDGEVALRLARELKVPGVVMVGGSDVLLLARAGRRRQAILKVLHSADAVVAVSEDLRRQLIKDGVDSERVHVVPRGIDHSIFFPHQSGMPAATPPSSGLFGKPSDRGQPTETSTPAGRPAGGMPRSSTTLNLPPGLFDNLNAPSNGAPEEDSTLASSTRAEASSTPATTQANPEKRHLLAVGRLVPVKGFDTLIEASRILRNRGVNLQTTIIGGGPLLKPLWKQVQESELTEIVKIVEPQSQNVLAKCYRAADLVVLPSLSEGIPNVLLEAIACGARFVASDVGGVPEIADREWDRLVPPGDPYALASACERMLNAPSPPKTPRRFVPQTWQDSGSQLMDILERLRFNTEMAQSLREPVHA